MYGDPSNGYGPISAYDGYDPLCMPMEPVALTAKENEPMSMEPTKVKVQKPFRVVHPDTSAAHTEGDVITVPEHLAKEWIRFGWVDPVTTTKEK
jgi:hypothetical protein